MFNELSNLGMFNNILVESEAYLGGKTGENALFTDDGEFKQ